MVLSLKDERVFPSTMSVSVKDKRVSDVYQKWYFTAKMSVFFLQG